MKHVDVVIAGGSLAGAVCARELRRMGIEAVAFDRDQFPRERVCGGFLSPGAVEILAELGVLSAVREAGAVDVTEANVRFPGAELQFSFSRPGLGISRKTLDAVLADCDAVRRGTVLEARRFDSGFRVRVDDDTILAKTVIDASGKLSRFTRRVPEKEFGIQFYGPPSRPGVLDFWFFKDGYGGSVGIEDGRSNACFLIKKIALPRYIREPGCRVTGPLAYRSAGADLIGVGDAAGMIDPFCGSGMHFALDTGRTAASLVALGLRNGWSYERLRRQYEFSRFRRWGTRRILARMIREALPHRRKIISYSRVKDRWIASFIQRFWE